MLDAGGAFVVGRPLYRARTRIRDSRAVHGAPVAPPTAHHDEEPFTGEPAMYRDYFVLDAEGMCWFISTAMARVVDAQLAAHPAPEWITFVDIVGSRVRVRTARVESLAESGQDQRAAYRAFRRAMSRERSSERNWGDE